MCCKLSLAFYDFLYYLSLQIKTYQTAHSPSVPRVGTSLGLKDKLTIFLTTIIRLLYEDCTCLFMLETDVLLFCPDIF